MGLRLNKTPANITYRKKMTGGVKFTATVPLTKLGPDPAKTVNQILHEYRIHNAEILFREDASVDELIDVLEGNRKYVRCLYLYNKVDTITIEETDSLAREKNSLVASVQMELNLDFLLAKVWEYLDMRRIYTKRRGEPPDFSEPVVLTRGRHGFTVEAVCRSVSLACGRMCAA